MIAGLGHALKTYDTDLRRILNYKEPSELVRKISQLKCIYRRDLCNAIKELDPMLRAHAKDKFRWVALVYKSDVLKRFIFNEALPFGKYDRYLETFAQMQNKVFDWYESKAESGSLLSVFQMALYPDYDLKKHPIFGFSRDNKPNESSSMINVSDIFTDEFVTHYYNTLTKEIGGAHAKQDTFKRVDEVIELASQSILATSIGFTSVSTIKYKLAEITGNIGIIRRSELEILSALTCLVVVDPGWKYYYYIPYANEVKSERPYAAMAIATSKPCDFTRSKSTIRTTMGPIFRLLDIVERDLASLDRSTDDIWEKLVSRITNPGVSALEQILIGLREIYRAKWGIELMFNGSVQDAQRINHRTGIVAFNRPSPKNVLISRPTEIVGESIKGIDIHQIIKDMDKKVEGISQKYDLGAPYYANSIKLVGWLDVDVIASTEVFARLSHSRIDVDRFANVLREYFGRCILGSGAIRTSETPDGWMCGFLTVEEALVAALKLVTRLKTELNEKLENILKDSFRLIDGGVGIRVGVHSESVTIELNEGLKDVAANALNHTGHLQKQGGIKFLQRYLEEDYNKPTRMDREENLLWVLALSSEAKGAFKELLEGENLLIVEFNRLNPNLVESATIDDDPEVCIYGKQRERNSLFDKIDELIEVDQIITRQERTYPYIKDEARYVIECLEKWGENDGANVKTCLDIGSGAGIYAIAMGLIFEKAIVEAIEPLSNAVVKWKRNVDKSSQTFGKDLSGRLRLSHATKFSQCKDELAKFWDVVAFNLPYVPSNDRENTFLHSYGGDDGLEYIKEVLEWIANETQRVGKVVFPIYSLAKCEDLKREYEMDEKSTLIYQTIKQIPGLEHKFRITYDAKELLPNWYVLGYSNDPVNHFVRLETAFPEARRRKDVAAWLEQLSSKYTHMWHSVIIMEAK